MNRLNKKIRKNKAKIKPKKYKPKILYLSDLFPNEKNLIICIYLKI